MHLNRPRLLVLTPTAASVYAALLVLAGGAYVLSRLLPGVPPWWDGDPSGFPFLFPGVAAGFACFYFLISLWALGLATLGHQLAGRRLRMGAAALPFIAVPGALWVALAREAWFPGLHKAMSGVLEVPILAVAVSVAALCLFRRPRSLEFAAWACWFGSAAATASWLLHGWVGTAW